jgi:hypothetical protein
MQDLDIFLTIVIGLIFSGVAMLGLQESYAQEIASSPISSFGHCHNGVDDDGNGLVDSDDINCKINPEGFD